MAEKKAEKKNESNIWLVAGNDEFAIKKKALELSVKLAPSGDPMGVEVIDCEVGLADEAFEKIAIAKNAVLTMPMFFSEKLVWMKNVNFFADSKLGGGAQLVEECNRFADLVLGGLPAGIRLLISAINPDGNRTSYKNLKKSTNFELCSKEDFTWKGHEEVVYWVGEQVRARGFSISKDAQEALAVRVGSESRQLDIELDKLAIVLEEKGHIGVETIRDLVPPTRQSGIFDLSNAIIVRDLRTALRLVEQLFLQKESPIALLLAAIVPTIRNLILVNELSKKHRLKLSSIQYANAFKSTIEKLPAPAIAHLPRKKDGEVSTFPLFQAAKGYQNYTAQELEKAFSLCRKTNRALVTTSLDPKIVLGKLLLEILT